MTQAVQQQMTAVAPKQPTMPRGGRWGWYRDHEGREWQRVSTMIKKVETDKYNLDQWMKRQVGEGLAIRDDLVLAIKAMGRPDPVLGWSSEDKRKLDGIMRDAAAAAKQADGARKGTALHDLTERLDRGEDIESVVRGLPAGPATILRAYDFLRKANGWRTVEIERTVVCDELAVAGTFDRIELIPGLAALLGPGTCQHGHPQHADELPVVMDVKSESQPWLNGLHIGPQLGIYSRAKRMWQATGGTIKVQFSESEGPIDFPAGTYVPVPCVRQDVGVVVHVGDNAAVPYFINLTTGWEAGQAARRQAERERDAKVRLGEPGCWFVPMPNVKRPAPAQLITDQAVAAQYADPNRPASAVSTATGAPVEHVATVRPDGNVDWQPAGVLDEVDKSAISAAWQAPDLASLAETWRIYTEICGREWGGRVAQAAEARRRQIECPQRQLHTGGKCACGWTPGVPA